MNVSPPVRLSIAYALIVFAGIASVLPCQLAAYRNRWFGATHTWLGETDSATRRGVDNAPDRESNSET